MFSRHEYRSEEFEDTRVIRVRISKENRQHYGQKKKTTLWSKEKYNTIVKRKRQHHRQKKKTILSSNEKDNTIVKRKRQHYRQTKKTALWSKEKEKQRSTNHTHKTKD